MYSLFHLFRSIRTLSKRRKKNFLINKKEEFERKNLKQTRAITYCWKQYWKLRLISSTLSIPCRCLIKLNSINVNNEFMHRDCFFFKNFCLKTKFYTFFRVTLRTNFYQFHQLYVESTSVRGLMFRKGTLAPFWKPINLHPVPDYV